MYPFSTILPAGSYSGTRFLLDAHRRGLEGWEGVEGGRRGWKGVGGMKHLIILITVIWSSQTQKSWSRPWTIDTSTSTCSILNGSECDVTWWRGGTWSRKCEGEARGGWVGGGKVTRVRVMGCSHVVWCSIVHTETRSNAQCSSLLSFKVRT